MDHLVGGSGAQVLEVVRVRRVIAELFDDGEEIGEGSDRGERGRLVGPVVAPSHGEQKGGFDEVEGNVLFTELGRQASVGGRGPAGRRMGQPAVEVEETLDVVAAHEGLFLRAAASASLSRRL